MVKVKIRGVEELNKNFAELDKKLQRVGLIKAVKEGGAIIQQDMEERAPFDPDSRHRKHLRDSIVTKFIRRGTQRVTQAIGPDKQHDWYAKFSELGTAHQTADPWMRPALNDTADEAQRAVGDQLWDTIEEVAK